ncbi:MULTISPECIES: site-specific DNA-methyltransferase [unclassified Flavobacterium]|uniref:site-specific DNA-methyltransferase n=1 Tax=unclassified Flavobacterium TaxID=196869 RepID=UPI00131B306F|nr:MULTISPECIES: site-specific DNA-methyltransferase [unclassified Flavobacterium]
MESINDYMPLSNDWNKERLQTLKQQFPDWFTSEGSLNIDEVKKAVNPDTVNETERYEFRWFGKSQAKRNAFTPSNATLVYDEARSVNPDSSENLIIEGENLEVLKLLSGSYREKIKCIYIDPPYNTGKDFVYSDNFTQDKKGYWDDIETTEEGVKIDTNSENDGRYHSNWLNMMYSRLLIARQLLREDGLVFISIDDKEVHNLRKLCDEVFGTENFIAKYVHKNNSTKNQAKLVSVSTEYFYCFAKNKEALKNVEWRILKKGAKDISNLFIKLKKDDLSLDEIDKEIKELYKRPKYSHLNRWNKVDENGVFKDADLSREGGSKDYTIINPTTNLPCVIPERGWGKSYEELIRLQEENLIWYGDENTPPGMKDYINADDMSVPDNFWYFDNSIDTRWIKSTFGALIFENPKPVEMIRNIIDMSTKKEDIILDFFGGSGTTGHSIFDLNYESTINRNFILIQIPEKTKIKSEAYNAGFKKISDITIARNKKVIEKIVKDKKTQQPDLFAEDQEGESLKNLGFKVFKLQKSNFPRVEFAPDPELSDAENLALLKKYIADKESQLVNAFNKEELMTEILLKNNFSLNYKTAVQTQFTKNEIILAFDDEKETLICLDVSIDLETVEYFKTNTEQKFICLERALDTTKKYNLKHYLGDKFNAF